MGTNIYFGNPDIFVYFTTNFTIRLIWGKSQNYLKLFTFPSFWVCFCFLGYPNTEPVHVGDIVKLCLKSLKSVYLSFYPFNFLPESCISPLWQSCDYLGWVSTEYQPVGPSDPERGRAKPCSCDCRFLTFPRSCVCSKTGGAWAQACLLSSGAVVV